MNDTLRDYQQEMKLRLFKEWELHRSVMVQMPTGTGKTHLLAAIVREFLRGSGSRVWIVAHRRELVEQIEETVSRHGMSKEDGRVRVMSIQWLSRNRKSMDEEPDLIVIDEAHHALAETYRILWENYPEARKLGMTATPCRLNGKGFTDLFDSLITSWTVAEFIGKGWLSSFDYVSIRANSREQRLIDSLKKRGADGDYQVKEMNEVLNREISIGRLYESVERYARGKKGIVYAVSIAHARRIAACYSAHGLEAVAIDSRTPASERRELVEDFRRGKVKVLVNVDIFSEGFDCPDVEFIQLARPTLSLAKYLQMVGRGLRVAKSKECCIILDNVGLYRLFGLPTTEWNWTAMFHGNQSGMGEVNMAKDFALKTIGACYSGQKRERMDMDNDTMVVIARHDAPRVQAQMQELADMYHTIRNLRKTECGYIGDGIYIRTIEKQGIYKTTNNVRLGWRMVYRTVDGVTHYYALHERSERMEYVGRRNPWSECATGIVKQYFYPCENNDNQLTEIPVEEPTYITGEKRKQQKGSIQQEVNGEYYMVTYVYYGVNKNKGKEFNSKDAYVCEHFMRNEYAISNNNNHIILRGLEKVKLSDDNIAEVVFEGEKKTTWVNLYTMQEFDKRPQVERMGFIELLKVGYNYYFYKNKKLAGIPLRDWGCAVNNRMFMFMEQYVILQEEPDKVYYVEGEYNKGRQWYLKLQDVWGKNPRKMKEIPSAYLPRKY